MSLNHALHYKCTGTCGRIRPKQENSASHPTQFPATHTWITENTSMYFALYFNTCNKIPPARIGDARLISSHVHSNTRSLPFWLADCRPGLMGAKSRNGKWELRNGKRGNGEMENGNGDGYADSFPDPSCMTVLLRNTAQVFASGSGVGKTF